MLIPSGNWLAVTAISPGMASLRILPHVPESPYPYLVGYNCLHEPAHTCPGGEWMAWPNGPLAPDFLFYSPLGGPYEIVVAKFVDDLPVRAGVTVVIPPSPGATDRG